MPKELDFIVYLNNLFVNQSFFAMLRKDFRIAAMNITRKNAQGIPADHIEKRDNERFETLNTFTQQVREVLCCLTQDSALFKWITTAYTLQNANAFIEIERRKPRITAKNKAIFEPVFDNEARKKLAFPTGFDNYNAFMHGGDIANQMRKNYDPQKRNYRIWKALFYFFLK